jgi:hypothetical protein
VAQNPVIVYRPAASSTSASPMPWPHSIATAPASPVNGTVTISPVTIRLAQALAERPGILTGFPAQAVAIKKVA